MQIEMKKPRYYYYRLASESSIGSEEDTESVYSVQLQETDVARDTTDTDSKSEDEGDDDGDIIEYEVASLSGSENDIILDLSTSGSEDQVIFAAAVGAMCDSSLDLDNWMTDCEESDNSSLADTSIVRLGFATCIQCKSINDNPLFRYCEKCFQDRKKMYPPRPRGNRKQRKKATEQPVKLDTLRFCLSGLSSQDSGVGSSQECPPLDLGQIIVPDIHLKQGTSLSDVKDILKKESAPKEHERELRRKRQASESSVSDYEIKKPKYTRPKSRGSRPSSRNSAKSGTCQPITESSISSQQQTFSSQTESKLSSLSQTSYDDISLIQGNKLSSLSQSSHDGLSLTDNKLSSLSQSSHDGLSLTDNKLSSLSQSSHDGLSLTDNKLSFLDQSSHDDISLSQASTITCSSLSQASTLSSSEKTLSTSEESSKTSGYSSECLTRTKSLESSQSNSEIISQVSNGVESLQSSSELCIMCNIAPKDSIFLHTNIGHQCCCYKCAKRTLHAIKRCPICNRSVNKIIKVYKV
ncbi:serine-rich adhesin for platelets isoform X2 [Diabrotica virgifera virgifera]|nr:serine-rich adhesin for platelets isoform X2 [Diabrotica virgifera virgifera]